MASTFTKEAMLIGFAAAIGVGAIAAYQVFMKGKDDISRHSTDTDLKTAEVKKKQTVAPSPEPGPSSSIRSPDASRQRYPDSIEAAREREKELEARLADANQRIAQMAQTASAAVVTPRNAASKSTTNEAPPQTDK